MKNYVIRDFQPKDMDGVVALYNQAFSEENRGRGMTPEAVIQQARSLTWGWTIPFRILMSVLRREWAVLVAEVQGQIVGACTHLGDRYCCEITDFMVAPAWQGQGIGQALMAEHLRRLALRGCKWATVHILNTNKPSLRVAEKFGFEQHGRGVVFLLALKQLGNMPHADMLHVRKFEDKDYTVLMDLEKKSLSPTYLEIEGSNVATFRSSLFRTLFRQLARRRVWLDVCEEHELVCGYGYTSLVLGATTASLMILAPHKRAQASLIASSLQHLPSTVQTLRVTFEGEHPSLPLVFQESVIEERTYLLLQRHP